jgi:RNA polymerase sigma-70 factor (ECF subfamily)
MLARLFGRHPESSRTIAVLHFVDGLTLEEVALETRMSVSGVRKRLRRLRVSLTELTGDCG